MQYLKNSVVRQDQNFEIYCYETKHALIIAYKSIHNMYENGYTVHKCMFLNFTTIFK